MTVDESIWIGRVFQDLAGKGLGFPMLNVGSGTKKFREVIQPQIYQNIFKPLEAQGAAVHHLDIIAAEGVDIIGDLSNPEFLGQVKKMRYQSILCNNLLEHVVNVAQICQAMVEVVADGGYLIITLPRLFPYHNAPIDTMFRPSPQELHRYFPGTRMVKGEVLTIDNSHFRTLMRNPKLLLMTLVRAFTPFYKFPTWKKIVSDFPNLFKNYQVTCVLLQKG